MYCYCITKSSSLHILSRIVDVQVLLRTQFCTNVLQTQTVNTVCTPARSSEAARCINCFVSNKAMYQEVSTSFYCYTYMD